MEKHMEGIGYLDLLGMRVKDRVTKLQGVVTSVGFDLYGCIQAVVNPGIGEDGKMAEPYWFDVARLVVVDRQPVMHRPQYEAYKNSDLKGPAEKPPVACV